MARSTTHDALSQPGSDATDPRHALQREGVRDLIAKPVGAKHAGYENVVLPDGCQALVRNGHLAARTVQTGISDVEVRLTRIRARSSLAIRHGLAAHVEDPQPRIAPDDAGDGPSAAVQCPAQVVSAHGLQAPNPPRREQRRVQIRRAGRRDISKGRRLAAHTQVLTIALVAGKRRGVKGAPLVMYMHLFIRLLRQRTQNIKPGRR